MKQTFDVTVRYRVEIDGTKEPKSPDEVRKSVELKAPDLGYGANPWWTADGFRVSVHDRSVTWEDEDARRRDLLAFRQSVDEAISGIPPQPPRAPSLWRRIRHRISWLIGGDRAP